MTSETQEVRFVVESFYIELPAGVDITNNLLDAIGRIDGVREALFVSRHRLMVRPALWVDLNQLAQEIVERIANRELQGSSRPTFSAVGNLGEGYVYEASIDAE